MIYLVVGFNGDDGDRFAEEVVADDASAAENHMVMKHPLLEVAGVITGENMKVVA